MPNRWLVVVVMRVELTWGTNPTVIILFRLADTNRLPYYPRSVHTHLQGLWVVFGLLISIPSARLTEQCCSHLLWLCESAESDLITSVARGFPLPSYTYIIPHFSGFVKGFFEFSSKHFQGSTLTLGEGRESLFTMLRLQHNTNAPLTLLLYHKSGDLSRGFSKVFEKFFQGSFALVSAGS